MSSNTEKTIAVSSRRVIETVKEFDAERLKAPFLLRCGALLIDYVLFIAAPVAALLAGRSLGYDGTKLLNSELSNASWLIAVLIALTNFIIFPLFGGQTLGKFLTGLRIVKKDGTSPAISNLLLRHLAGYPLTLLTGGLGFLFSVFNNKGRALHDFLGGTILVYGKRRREKMQ